MGSEMCIRDRYEVLFTRYIFLSEVQVYGLFLLLWVRVFSFVFICFPLEGMIYSGVIGASPVTKVCGGAMS